MHLTLEGHVTWSQGQGGGQCVVDESGYVDLVVDPHKLLLHAYKDTGTEINIGI